MKRKIIITAILIIISLYSISQNIPDHIKDMARTALEYSKSEQYEKALSVFNKLISYSEKENNNNLTILLKKQKINCYWGIAEKKVNNDIKYGLLEACNNGLRLCKEINEQYSFNSMMFSTWMAGYYYMNEDYEECSYAIEYTKRLIKECQNRNIESDDILNDILGMITRLENEVHKLTVEPPLTYSLSLGALYNALTANSSMAKSSSSNNNNHATTKIIENEESMLKIIIDGNYKYGQFISTKYKIICPNGYQKFIYYNMQKKCWMKTSSITCDYSSMKGQEGLKKSAKILCGNH